MSVEKRITELKEALNKAKDLRYKAEAKKETLLKQKEELVEEIRKEGVEPENLEAEIKSLEETIARMTKEIEGMIPWDILKQ